MARVVSCHHCGASHRPARGQTRFTCEWCGGENLGQTDRGQEVLVVDSEPSRAAAESRALETLRRRGIEPVRVVATSPSWVGIWQVVADSGDALVRSAQRSPSRVQAAFDLPTAPFVSMADYERPPSLEPIGDPEVDADEVVAAARATFSNPEDELAALRLVWIPVCELRITTRAGVTGGFYLGGADEVILEPMPLAASDPPPRPQRIAAFGIYLFVALMVGLVVSSPWLRAGLLAAGWMVAVFAWPMLTDSGNRSTT